MEPTPPDGTCPDNRPPHRRNCSRPYRSKRHPPCNQCRKRKLRCQTSNGASSCFRCQADGSITCSFSSIQRERQSEAMFGLGSPSTQEVVPVQSGESGRSPFNRDDSVQCQTQPIFPVELSTGSHATEAPVPADGGYFPLEEPYPYHFPQRPATQAIQSLDLLEGFSSQLIGASGESDPWLLRHCKFDDHGFLLFHQVHFRNAGGVPLDEKIPVHFLVTANQLYDSAKVKTKLGKRTSDIRDELNDLVPLEFGRRIVALFVKYIFPFLPVVYRSQLGLTACQTVPEQHVLQNMPVHLLAAIYASALPFAKFDESLCVFNAYSDPPIEQLWHIVLELFQEGIHTPHLADLQAGLLYLHKRPEGIQRAVADSPFVWSFVGSLVGLATSLGLQLECRPMGLPAWERRLRRRLWWVVYAEDKWRSLLMGRPPYIRNDEWDVTELDDEDLRIDRVQTGTPCDTQYFMHFVRLSRIADDAQQGLFSLLASQRLSSNFPDTLAAVRSFLQRLKEWFAHLPASLKSAPGPSTMTEGAKSQSTCLHFAYILLEVFIFRALLRPMVRSAAPPPLLEETEDPAIFANFLNDYIFHTMEAGEEVEPVPAIDMSDEYGTGSTVIKAAENCAAVMLRLVTRMTCGDLGSFWYSWSRIGFATVSNFMMLLLVQAPSRDNAARAKRLVEMWRQALRSQSQGCELMHLALLRLDGLHWAGLGQNFALSKHVKEALNCAGSSQR